MGSNSSLPEACLHALEFGTSTICYPELAEWPIEVYYLAQKVAGFARAN